MTVPNGVASRRVKSRGRVGGRVRQSRGHHRAVSGVTPVRSRVLRFGVASAHCESDKAVTHKSCTDKVEKSQRLSETWLDFARIIVSAELTGRIRSEDSQR